MSDLPADLSSITIFDFFAYLVADDDAATARESYCEVVAAQIANVAAWLGVDAWLGAGDVADTGADVEQASADPTRRRSFVAVGLVAQIASELVSGALLLFRNGNQYGGSALVRQLIECEYLLRAFRLNFDDAARWHDANDSDRWDFKPSKLREIGGFDRKEYADHCEAGGHPHPAGRALLDLERAMQALAPNSRKLDVVRLLWVDFALHCDRVWRALSDVLSEEHARFDRVRAEAIAAVAESRSGWHDIDTLARHAGPVLGAFYEDPMRPLSELVDLTEET